MDEWKFGISISKKKKKVGTPGTFPSCDVMICKYHEKKKAVDVII